jgi:RNA polymerase sigma-70 factor (ECF subfamily)
VGWRDPAGITVDELQGSAPAPGDADEAAVVTRAREDPLAFAPLYRQLFPAVHGYCLRRLGDPEEAADATAQTFTRALAALPRFRPDPYRPGATFRSWLFAIAHNVVVDAERRRGRGTRLLTADESLEANDALGRLVDAGPSPEEWAVAADEGRRLRALLLRLSEGQRRVVELRLAGLTGAEIAASLGMSVGAVKATQFRAYARLRTLLSDDAPATEGGR